ncbi:DUF421 domain-containing protein [Rhodobacter sp. SGA-6-6]|uniref:DUF421 domain-containing protein n=1 Tax=Rhodobacter sp. SGA-6-6 TaxID=2710882 RepID=UPI0013EDD391|nr:YetF domain-containing protein [Rhodobacter sp. SGA-6-6]NGM46144.1 DUF421 domain-containing protein [Rhodobacter sp. SGA-6-6]
MDQITAFDWQRMLIGEEPPLFLLEIVFRILVIWPWTMLLLRWIGGRSISQLSLVEFLLVIALGSAVGDSLFIPEVPLLHAMLAILVVVFLDKIVDMAIRRYRLAKRLIDGHPVEVVRDGTIQTGGLSQLKMGSLELMELLRLRGVENLGSIRRAYLEPSGQVSVFCADPPQPGLPIVPPVEFRAQRGEEGETGCCSNCGHTGELTGPCGNCGFHQRLPAEPAPRWR